MSNPVAGSRLVGLDGKDVGVFTGEVTTCLCGGDSMKLQLRGVKVASGWCRELFEENGDNWTVREESRTWFIENAMEVYAMAAAVDQLDWAVVEGIVDENATFMSKARNN